MKIWLWVVIGILILIIIVLLIKIYLLRKAAKEIEAAFAERLTTDTNTLISISSNDRSMRNLANAINIQLRQLRAEVLKQLTEELFRYSVIVTKERNLESAPVVINRVLEESVAAFYTDFCEHNIIPKIQIPEENVIRYLDRSALSRVFSNLLNNAMKYSDGDLEIVLSESGEIIFSNTASGLNEVQVGKLFDRFYTVEAARKSTGLGLSIARTLVEQMDGTISAVYENNHLSICLFFPILE